MILSLPACIPASFPVAPAIAHGYPGHLKKAWYNGWMYRQLIYPDNFLLMHAMGPNVAGVIGSAVAAGVLISMLGNK